MAFKVQIVDINENFDNIILTNNLTIERLKIKYNWILNASVKDCIIGEDEYGIVWYSGEWICGEWEDGTWISGIWHDGTWKNGKWYSYLIDKAMVISNRFVILDKSIIYSEFRAGLWKQGNFYNGIFGYDRNISGMTYTNLIGKTFSSAYWYDGKFHEGLFKNSVWYNGVFYYGDMINSYWLDGKFYSGTFNFHVSGGTQSWKNWYDGNWYGGDFVEGYWGGGNFDQINTNIKSRFGTANLTDSMTIWNGGYFYNGEFHSGLNIDSSGNTLPSVDNNKTYWESGKFMGGKWYGGHFCYGDFYNGYWYGGVFNRDTGTADHCKWHDGNWYNGLWINGIFYDGHFYNGIWLNGQFINGYMSTNTVENPLLKQVLANDVSLPSATATTASVITQLTSTYSATLNGRVTNNGGATILDRGICWDTSTNPTTGSTGVVRDGGSTGNISVLVNGLIYNTIYNYRVFVSNITGLTYSNVASLTVGSDDQLPTVTTLEAGGIGSEYFTGRGRLDSSPLSSLVTEYGFIWATGSTELVSGITTDVYQGQISIIGTLYNEEVFTYFINTLTGNTDYHYKAYAINSIGMETGNTVDFTTEDYSIVSEPTVVTYDYEESDIGSTTATISGQITDDGGEYPNAIGVCWDDFPSTPTISGNVESIPVTTEIFYAYITGLTYNIKYNARAFGINSAGTGYGDTKSFTTGSVETIPTVIIYDITAP